MKQHSNSMTQTLSGIEVAIAWRKCESGDRADDQISKSLLLAAVSRHCLDYLKSQHEELTLK